MKTKENTEIKGTMAFNTRIHVHKLRKMQRSVNLWAPRFLYTGQAFRYSPENAFYILNQQIYFII